MNIPPLRIAPLLSLALAVASSSFAESAARIWNEQNLAAIRIDFPNPPVHARNLFHTSVAMYDAWAAYDPTAVGYVHNEMATAGDVEAARHEAVSYAAYRVLYSRYGRSVNASTSRAAFNLQMAALGYNINNTSLIGGSPAAVGNRVAAAVLEFGASDNSRETFNYNDPTYSPVNQPLILLNDGTTMLDPNRWQPLAFDVAFTQNGLVADKVQIFVASHWNSVRPFALKHVPGTPIYHDPGPPPYLGGVGDAEFKAGSNEVIYRSSLLDPDSGDMIDISPGNWGNIPLDEIPDLSTTEHGPGHPVNPATGLPYEPNIVAHGDFGRVLAEFWADGPHSETPPGHWNVLANEITEHPDFERRFGGAGPEVSELEWDVKVYFALNGAVHDVAVAEWGCKRYYDYVRPISSIRYMAGRGQSTDPGGPSYDPMGIALVPGLVEVITAESSAPGERHAHLSANVGDIAIRSWIGEPADPDTQYSGVGWILAETWFPYQRDTFVTPAFAGYVSGHSGFSRAAAEVLTLATGSPFFPGGMGTFTAPQNEYLQFELGPSTDIVLQWGTYYDAADQAGISRLYGGIHVPADDVPGRRIGQACGKESWALASKYFDGSILEEPFSAKAELLANGDLKLTWDQIHGQYYQVQTTGDLVDFDNEIWRVQALTPNGEFIIPDARSRGPNFHARVARTPTP